MKFIRISFVILLFFLCFFIKNLKAESDIGVVNFSTCISDSNYGKQEQEEFEKLKNQITSLINDKEKHVNELYAKSNDSEFRDSLSPEAEKSFLMKFQTSNEELINYKNQYNQIMNQAHIKLIQTMSNYIKQTTEKISREKKLKLVISNDICFYFDKVYDITNIVVKEMDKSFENFKREQKTSDNEEKQKNK